MPSRHFYRPRSWPCLGSRESHAVSGPLFRPSAPAPWGNADETAAGVMTLLPRVSELLSPFIALRPFYPRSLSWVRAARSTASAGRS